MKILSLIDCLGLQKIDRHAYLIGDEPRRVYKEVFGTDPDQSIVDRLVQSTRVGDKAFVDLDYGSAKNYLMNSPEKSSADMAAKLKSDKEAMAQRFAQNKQEITDFNTRYTTAVPQIINDTSNKYQLGQLLGITNNLGTRVNNLQTNADRQGAGGYANAGQVDAAVSGRYLPQYNQSIQNLERGTALAQTEQSALLRPFETEKDLLNDRIARESVGYSDSDQRELDALIAKLNANTQLTTAEMQRATQLALAEKSYQQAVDVAKANNSSNKYINVNGGLYNTETGQWQVRPSLSTFLTG